MEIWSWNLPNLLKSGHCTQKQPETTFYLVGIGFSGPYHALFVLPCNRIIKIH